MWYNHLSEYFINQGYENNELCLCVFIKKLYSSFTIVAVYVNDMNLIGTLEELEKTASHLKSKFEMKDLEKTRFCLDLELEHCVDGILLHQSNYTQKVLRLFNEDKVKHSSTLMIVHTLDATRDSFRPKEDEKEVLEPEVPYLSAIGTLLYLGLMHQTRHLICCESVS